MNKAAADSLIIGVGIVAVGVLFSYIIGADSNIVWWVGVVGGSVACYIAAEYLYNDS